MSGRSRFRSSILVDFETVFSLIGNCSHALLSVICLTAWLTSVSRNLSPKYPQFCTRSSSVPGCQSSASFWPATRPPRGAPVALVDQPSFLIDVLKPENSRRYLVSRKSSICEVVCGPRNG